MSERQFSFLSSCIATQFSFKLWSLRTILILIKTPSRNTGYFKVAKEQNKLFSRLYLTFYKYPIFTHQDPDQYST